MRVDNKSNIVPSTSTLVSNSARQIANFIKVSPEEHRKIAELICSIGDQLGTEAAEILHKFVTAVQSGNISDFVDYCNDKQVPMSIISDVLALSQEIEAHTKEKLDDLVLKAKRGAIQLSKAALKKAILLLV